MGKSLDLINGGDHGPKQNMGGLIEIIKKVEKYHPGLNNNIFFYTPTTVYDYILPF